MKKKVLFMVYYLNLGGVEKALLNLLKYLDENKYNITILMVEKKGELITQLPSHINIKEVIIDEKQKNQFLYGNKVALNKSIKKGDWKNSIIIIKQMFEKYFDKDIDVFEKKSHFFPEMEETYDIAIDFHGYTSFTTFYVATKVKAPIKYSWIHAEMKNNDLRWFTKYYDRMNKIFCVSKICRDQFTDIFPEYSSKAEVLYNMLCSDEINKLANISNPFKEIDCETLKLVTVGRLSKEKGYDLVIESSKILKKLGYDFKWYLIGEGPYRRHIEEQIVINSLQNFVKLVGYESNPYPYVKNSDIYIQTSLHEGYCIALAEARMLGKVIITTNFKAAFEQIENSVTGLIVNYDSEQIVNAIIHLVKTPELKRILINNLKKEISHSHGEIDRIFNNI